MQPSQTYQELARDTADWINQVLLHDFDFGSYEPSAVYTSQGVRLAFYGGPASDPYRTPCLFLWGEDIAANFWFELALLMTDSKGYDAWLEDCNCVEFSITTGNFFHDPDWAHYWGLETLAYDRHYTYLTIALTNHAS